ncbi:MAG: gamma-aminobutyraldehyde dehydrogenase [Candidatus Nanopelagicales bacterium]
MSVAGPVAGVVNGAPIQAASGETLDVVDPADGSVVETVGLAGAPEVDAAVSAAREAFPAWATATPAERGAALHRLASRLEARADEYALVESRQTGKTLRLATEFDVPGSIDNVVFFAGAARQLEGLASGEYDATHTSVIRREPVGVVGSVAPWNYPLQMAMWKVLPAIAAGNTIVLKPAEITPLTTLMLAQDAAAAGIPDGVINVVVGRGPVAGEALIGHPAVGMVSFTGSTPVGRRVMEIAAGRAARVHLELGGKAPFVVFDDADVEAAVHGAVAGALINAGQDCTAATRVYVQRPLFEAVVGGIADLLSSIRVGDPRDPEVDLGPLVTVAQRDRVAGFVDRARGAGAQVVVGGEVPTGDLAKGAFYAPTLITGAAQDSEIVQEEVFGPVLVALPFDSDEEGIALANDTRYGLAASAWTRDVYRAQRAQREIRSGCVWINDHIPIVSEMPHGGMKQSGFGKDMSRYSLDEYTVVKHVSWDISGAPRKDWHRTIFTDRST